MRRSIVRKSAFAVAAALALLCESRARADSVTLTPSKDNTLYEDSGGTLSNGAGQYFFAGTNLSGSLRRGVIAFDVSLIPAGSTVTSVTLTLYMDLTNAGDEPVSLNRLSADWGEGTSAAGRGEGGGAPSTPGDATWVHTFYDTSFWTAPGGDFVSAPSATAVVSGAGTFYTWSSPEMTADVQAWVAAAAPNAGWILIGVEDSRPTAKRFASKDNLDPMIRPMLSVLYTPPGTGAGSVPDRSSAGTPLTLAKSGTDLALSWGGSCMVSDTDYEVYEGTLGSFTSHVPLACSTSGATSATIMTALDEAYYLVVPRNSAREGSYGLRTGGIERPPSALACLAQLVLACP